MNLSDRYTRCWGARCNVSHCCERFLQRDTGGKHTKHLATLRDNDDKSVLEFCEYAIPVDDDKRCK